MNRKITALLLSAFVLPGLGQLYLGRRNAGIAIILLVNLILLVALFVVLKGLSPVIASRVAGGAVSITPADVNRALQGASTLGKGVLAGFFLVWAFALADILKQGERPSAGTSD